MRQAPWCWPPLEHPALRTAEQLAGGPPELAVGQVALLTRQGGTGALWSLCCGSTQPTADHCVRPLTGSAASAWHNVCRAVPRVLQVLAGSVNRYREHKLEAVRLARFTPEGTDEVECRVLDGGSVGLPLFIGLASLVLRAPPPADIVATGVVDEYGGVNGVDGLKQKIGVVLAKAPRLRRLLVAAEQAGEAEALAGARLEVIGVEHVRQAVEPVFGDVEERVLALGTTPAVRERLVGEWFDIALAGRQELLDWSPFARLAELALERWDLNHGSRERLRAIRDIARRHMGLDGGRHWDLDPDDVVGDARMFRLVAHQVQAAADTGDPQPGRALDLADHHLPGPGKPCRSPEQVMVRGARARLLAMVGEHRRALAEQQVAIEEFLELATQPRQKAEASYPLTECYRLSGLLGDGEAFDSAEAVERDLRAHVAPNVRPYYLVARYRALVSLAPERATDAHYQEVLRACEVPFLACSLRRTRAWQLRLEGRVDEADVVLREIEEAASRSPEVGGRYLALARLDLAVLIGDAEAARRHLEQLRAFQRGRVALLERSSPTPGEAPEHVARCYPY